MKTIKVTFNLPVKQIELIQRIAYQENLTFTEVLRRAINTEMLFVDIEKKGHKMLVETAEKIRKRIKRI